MKLERQLGVLEVFSIASGAMISSGIFILPAIAYSVAGPAVIFSYLFAGILILPALFSKLELSTALPKAGGIYFFSERILGSTAGVVNGFAGWFSLSMKSAFALIGIGAFATLIFPDISEWQIKLIASGACILFGIINLFSVKASGKLQIIMVAILLLILTTFIIVGYRKVDFSHLNFGQIAFDWKLVFATTGMVFVSYGGLTKVASIAEEVRDLKKNLVRGMIAAYVVVQIIYLLVLFVIIGVMPGNLLAKSLTPISDTANYFFSSSAFNQFFVIITAAAGMLAFITTANAGIMAASRSPMAMSRDGLIPDLLSKVSPKNKTPYVAVILTTLFMLTIILILPIVKLVKVASLFKLMLFAMVNLSVIIIRSSKIKNYKPSFRSPFFPLIQILGIVFYIVLIIGMGTFTIMVALGFILLAVLWFFIYSRKKVKRKSALVYMIESVTNPQLVQDESELELEDELLDILIERNEIVEDRFDTIIRQAPVLDLHKTITRDELFKMIAEIVSKKLEVDQSEIEKKLNVREEDSSTLIYPGVAVPHAIPHVIIEGEHIFDIILVRNKYGIIWNEKEEIVYKAFCLIGSKDERNFHLKALAAIAQVLMDPDFHKEWEKAKHEDDIRTSVLLTKRTRESGK
ncbi:MAG: amino acid permease [Spirochaetes bacterium]|nr:amino acid permease [Spirochaetota bacterium]